MYSDVPWSLLQEILFEARVAKWTYSKALEASMLKGVESLGLITGGFVNVMKSWEKQRLDQQVPPGLQLLLRFSPVFGKKEGHLDSNHLVNPFPRKTWPLHQNTHIHSRYLGLRTYACQDQTDPTRQSSGCHTGTWAAGEWAAAWSHQADSAWEFAQASPPAGKLTQTPEIPPGGLSWPRLWELIFMISLKLRW